MPTKKVLAVLGGDEGRQRFDAPRDHQQVVGVRRQHGIDEIVAGALVAQIDLQPVVEEGEEADRQLGFFFDRLRMALGQIGLAVFDSGILFFYQPLEFDPILTLLDLKLEQLDRNLHGSSWPLPIRCEMPREIRG